MRCERCQNTDPKYFYNDKGTYYCRRCIAFGRLDVGIVPKAYTYVPKRHRCNYDLEFQLTDQQLKADGAFETGTECGEKGRHSDFTQTGCFRNCPADAEGI